MPPPPPHGAHAPGCTARERPAVAHPAARARAPHKISRTCKYMTHGGCACQPDPYSTPAPRRTPPQANLQECITRQRHNRETHTADRDSTQRKTAHSAADDRETTRPKTIRHTEQAAGQTHALGRGQGQNRCRMKVLRRRGESESRGGMITGTYLVCRRRRHRKTRQPCLLRALLPRRRPQPPALSACRVLSL